jgi:copper chaperone CopZ
MIVVFATELKAHAPKSDLMTVYFKSNMDCVDCEVTLNNYIKFEKGVKDLKVEWKSNTIKIVYKSGKNTPENLAKGIKKQGYETHQITEEQYNILMEEAARK